MKALPILCLFFIFNLTTTDIIGTYQIESKNSFDTLNLRNNGTYTYLLRGDSCWMWRDINGKWELKDDILILHYKSSLVKDEKYTFSFRNGILKSIQSPNFSSGSYIYKKIKNSFQN
jgi:hypothetical protein